jgi:hypothetical protein
MKEKIFYPLTDSRYNNIINSLFEDCSDIEITRNYKFYQHPIKWFKDIKKIKIAKLMANKFYKNNKDLLNKSIEDMMLYGTSIINKKDIK